MLDLTQIKKDFPILNKETNERPLVFLDNASTSQKPYSVINAITEYYENFNANIHRGVYSISEKASVEYEKTRKSVKEFINAKSVNEIIFTKNTTEAINIVAYSWATKNIEEGDEILISEFEHHANLIPWQLVAKSNKAKLVFIPITKSFDLDYEAFEKLINEKTKLVAITGMSNVTGTIINLKVIKEKAQEYNSKLLVDGAQLVAHKKVDVQSSDIDFLTFSSHKMLGATGVGILYAKEEILEDMPPLIYGGGIVKEVTKQDSSFQNSPTKFEAGTPNIADIIAFQEALKYLSNIGLDKIEKHEKELYEYAYSKLINIDGLKLYCPANFDIASGIISFTIDGVHPHDIAEVMNNYNVCIRAGHHCNQPLMNIFNVSATARMSFYLYNTKNDIDTAIKAINKCIEIFK